MESDRQVVPGDFDEIPAAGHRRHIRFRFLSRRLPAGEPLDSRSFAISSKSVASETETILISMRDSGRKRKMQDRKSVV